MLPNNLPDAINRSWVLNDRVSWNNRSVICYLAEHHFQMGHLLCGCPPSRRRNRFVVIGETAKRWSVRFLSPRSAIGEETGEVRVKRENVLQIVLPSFERSDSFVRSKRPLFRSSLRSHSDGKIHGLNLTVRRGEFHWRNFSSSSVGSLRPWRCHHASKLSRNSEQARLLHNARQTTETDRGKTRDAENKVT